LKGNLFRELLMKTDIPLKLLTALRGADLLPWLGLPAAELLRVESRELPAGATRLDSILRIRSPQGQEYLHIIEWQGYYDPAVLWRLAGYLAWFGQQEPQLAVVGTVVYLAPAYDVGDTLEQWIDGTLVRAWPLGRIALWEQDAPTALASARLGLVVLSPLMRNADAQLVETAAQLVLQQAPIEQQGDLLSILGVFAEPLLEARRFISLVGRERLMRSELFDYLIKDREAELQAQFRQQEAQFRQQEAQFRQEFQQALEDTFMVRFPKAPMTLLRDIRRIHNPAELRRLIIAVQQAADLAAAEHLVHAAAAQADAHDQQANGSA
jgi:hypothetical protein